MSASLPAKDVLKKTEDEWNAHHRPHRPQQAQEGSGELQGGDAEARRPGLMRARRNAFELSGRARGPSGLSSIGGKDMAVGALSSRMMSRCRRLAARDVAAARGAALQAVAAAAADRAVPVRADAGAAAAALFLVPPVDGLSRLLVGRRIRRPRPVPGRADRSALRLGGGALARLRHRLDASAASCSASCSPI